MDRTIVDWMFEHPYLTTFIIVCGIVGLSTLFAHLWGPADEQNDEDAE